jgi:hypothetical protein
MQTANVLFSAFVLLLHCLSSAGQPNDLVRLLVPRFTGPAQLGQNVATVLNLQVWQTLRRAPTPNPNGLNFGNGEVTWDDEALSVSTYTAAEQRAAITASQLVLWGEAVPYGEGVIARTFLSIPPAAGGLRRYTDILTVDVGAIGRHVTVSIDIPARRYEFAPVVLRREVVDTYTSPAALLLYSAPQGGSVVGQCGEYFTALRHDSGAVLVSAAGRQGWVRLPELATQPSEVVDFVAGVLRVFRGDWGGAQPMFSAVIDNTHTPTSIKIDSYLYLAICRMATGLDPRGPLDKARELNPYSSRIAEYIILDDLGRLMSLRRNGAPKPEQSAVLAQVDQDLSDAQVLFDETDPFPRSVREATALLRASLS